jgi:hypothetical protein
LLPKGEHPRDLLPGFSLVQWPYTDLSLKCWTISRSFIGLNAAEVDQPQKIGLSDWRGWLAYWVDGQTFVKYTTPGIGGEFPDFGSRMEVFSDGKFLELETLGALSDIEPKQTVQHEEYWTVLADLPEPKGEEEVGQVWFPAVERWVRNLPGSGRVH